MSADAFENLKPAPDIFLAASDILNVPPSEVYLPQIFVAGCLFVFFAMNLCLIEKGLL